MDKLKLRLKKDKYYRLGILMDAMKEAGASWHSKTALLNQENQGRLTMPRIGKTGHRMVTEDQIIEIIEAFSPGGTGEWHYDKSKS